MELALELELALVKRSSWRRHLIPVVLLTALLGVFCAIPMGNAVGLVTGEAVTAQVEGCAKEGKYNVCRGSWVFSDGSSGTGPINGVGGDDVGRAVDVWAVHDQATTSRLAWATTPALFGAILMALVIAVGVSRRARTRF